MGLSIETFKTWVTKNDGNNAWEKMYVNTEKDVFLLENELLSNFWWMFVEYDRLHDKVIFL